MLSTEKNCIFYNALTKNSNPYDDQDVVILQKFRTFQDDSIIQDYYDRASKIVTKLNLKPVNQTELWTDITDRYVKSILDSLRADQLDETMTKLQTMLEELEQGA